MNENENVTNATPVDQILSVRREKLDRLREAGVNPYPATVGRGNTVGDVRSRYEQLQTGESSSDSVSVAGRIVSRREMGKASFIDLSEFTGRIQAYVRADAVGADSFRVFKDLVDISDYLLVTGTPFRTRTGELSIKVERWELISKSLRPLPEKWHGLKDTETRYRQRYLDLIANPSVRDVFVKRSLIISTIRRVLESKGFLEVETPMMQVIPGGAAAKPFTTHHNALDLDLYMRIAPELYLKRLVVGGLERVFEIGRNFRNEGIDRNHNPEFTMMELYQAYADFQDMMDITEELIAACARKTGAEVSTPFRRARMFDLLQEATGKDLRPLVGSPELLGIGRELGLDIPSDTPPKKVLDHIFDKLVQPNLQEPTFVIDFPAVYSPLAKTRADQPDIAERFELFMNGMEIGNAYSEMNDPVEQRRRFVEQVEARRQGDDEAQPYDEDFITALEHGLPPTGGLGIGIDRLAMFLANVDSVREVILFPVLRPE